VARDWFEVVRRLTCPAGDKDGYATPEEHQEAIEAAKSAVRAGDVSAQIAVGHSPPLVRLAAMRDVGGDAYGKAQYAAAEWLRGLTDGQKGSLVSDPVSRHYSDGWWFGREINKSQGGLSE